MKYKVGDMVTIKKHPSSSSSCENSRCPSWNSHMDGYIGKEVIIREVKSEGKYRIEGCDSWTWGECMFETNSLQEVTNNKGESMLRDTKPELTFYITCVISSHYSSPPFLITFCMP